MKKNWKTSLAGIFGALLISFGPQAGARLSGDRTAPPITTATTTTALAVAVLGLLAKDGDVTGGTR